MSTEMKIFTPSSLPQCATGDSVRAYGMGGGDGVLDRSFEDWVRVALPDLRRYARALTGDRHAADDLVQDTLVRVAGGWRRVRVDGSPTGYARTAMFRTYVSRWRVLRRRGEPLVLVDEYAAGTDDFAGVDARLLLRAALNRLPRLQRAVLVASYLEDLPDEQVAVLVGRTPSTVRSLRRRGLIALRAVMSDPAPAGAPRLSGHRA
jgi:RNA polymerase sigma factor (sigma-70 family)